MKIVVIGGTGLIGQAIINELSPRHEVICVGHSSGEFTVDIEQRDSINNLYQRLGPMDAVVLATGRVSFVTLNKLNSDNLLVGINNKLLGQVNCVLAGLDYLNDGGSFTLTSGILNEEPIALGSSAAMVNGAIDGFVTAAALEMPRGIRINAVSPTVVTEALDVYGPYFRGYEPVPLARVARAYSKSVEGLHTGKVLKAR